MNEFIDSKVERETKEFIRPESTESKSEGIGVGHIITVLVCIIAMATIGCWVLFLSNRSLDTGNQKYAAKIPAMNKLNADLLEKLKASQDALKKQNEAVKILLTRLQAVQSVEDVDDILYDLTKDKVRRFVPPVTKKRSRKKNDRG